MLTLVRYFTHAMAVVLLAVSASAVAADSATPEVAEVDVENETGKRCIDLDRIKRTRVLDNERVLVTMYGGQQWTMLLRSSCRGLKFDGGFAYERRTHELCAGLDSIRLLRSGRFCHIEGFETYEASEDDGAENAESTEQG